MDPIGFTARIITLVLFAGQVAQGLDKLIQVKNAPKELQANLETVSMDYCAAWLYSFFLGF